MARTGSGSDGDERRAVGHKRSLRSVEAINIYLISAQVRGKGKAIIGGSIDGKRVRPSLAFRVYAVSRVRQMGGGLAQAPVGKYGKDRDAANSVIGHQRVLAGVVHGKMGGAGVAGGNDIQQA